MKLLCLTADDFGLDPGIDTGILECIQARAVRNVSIWLDALANPFPAPMQEALRACAVGLHWPLFPPTVDLNRPRDWPRVWSWLWPDRATLAQQLERIGAGFASLVGQGLQPVFLNGHQHVHLLPAWIGPLGRWAVAHGLQVWRQPRELGPGSWRSRLRRPGLLMLELVGRLGERIARRLPLRWIPAICRWGRGLPLDELDAALAGIETSPLEVVVHPGHPTDSYRTLSQAPIEFDGQVAALTSTELHRVAGQRGFRFGRLDEVA